MSIHLEWDPHCTSRVVSVSLRFSTEIKCTDTDKDTCQLVKEQDLLGHVPRQSRILQRVRVGVHAGVHVGVSLPVLNDLNTDCMLTCFRVPAGSKR